MKFWKIMKEERMSAKCAFHADGIVLPYIRCEDCGETWGMQARSSITRLPPDSIKAVRSRVCTPHQWNNLKKTLESYLPSERRSENLFPGMQVGIARVSKIENCNCDFLWSGYGHIFITQSIADMVKRLCSSAIIFEEVHPIQEGIVEIIPLQVDFKDFGEVPLCSACGFTDDANLDIYGALEHMNSLYGEIGNIYQIPGAKIVDQGLKKALEKKNFTNVQFDSLGFD